MVRKLKSSRVRGKKAGRWKRERKCERRRRKCERGQGEEGERKTE